MPAVLNWCNLSQREHPECSSFSPLFFLPVCSRKGYCAKTNKSKTCWYYLSYFSIFHVHDVILAPQMYLNCWDSLPRQPCLTRKILWSNLIRNGGTGFYDYVIFDCQYVIALLKAASCAFSADNKGEFWSEIIFDDGGDAQGSLLHMTSFELSAPNLLQVILLCDLHWIVPCLMQHCVKLIKELNGKTLFAFFDKY